MTQPHDIPPPAGRSSFNVGRSSRRDSISSNMSRASFVREVEMAQDEMFSGPVSDNMHSSVASFAHRRPRAGTGSSFQYFHVSESFRDQIYNAGLHPDQQAGPSTTAAVESDEESDGGYSDTGDELETTVNSRRRKVLHIRDTIEDSLLERHESARTDLSGIHGEATRVVQEIYVEQEDLRMVIGGHTTNNMWKALSYVAAIPTLGIGWLLLQWIPKWRIRLLGNRRALHDADWLAVENQWGQLEEVQIKSVRYDKPLSTVFGSIEQVPNPTYDLDVDNDPILHHIRYFDYRYIRFCYHPIKDKFIMITGYKDPVWINVDALREGVSNDDVEPRQLVFGENDIKIESKTTAQLLMDEAVHPFYIFQVFSLILWSVDEYYYYAACIFFISAFSIGTTLIETKRTMARLSELSRFVCSVRVYRDGFWSQVDSNDLVPGDVYEVSDPALTQFPCDSILLTGDCIVNESMLTGESVPVSKSPCITPALKLLDLGASSVAPTLAKHFLFCGTKIIRSRKPHTDGADEAVSVAVVVRTGFNTTKGALVRSMLFPKPSDFKFYRDSFRYIGVMGIIAALGFIASLINFIHLKLPAYLVIVRALDLITIVVPPALPATLTIGTSFALSRLKKSKIFCISPTRINVAGKLDVVCFDKTGTLTEDGLDVLGVRVVEQGKGVFSELYTAPESLIPEQGAEAEGLEDGEGFTTREAMLKTMATCHSLNSVDGEMIGDPLDVKMFEFTRWRFEEIMKKRQGANGTDGPSNGDAPGSGMVDGVRGAVYPPWAKGGEGLEPDDTSKGWALAICKQFEFVSNLRRASVVVRHFRAKGGYVYVKGAPECMRDICKPETLPEDYDELLAYYTHRGYRVIGCAAKYMPKLSWVRGHKLKRGDAEKDLDFIGFIIFENKLKPQTEGVINELERAGIRKVMVTGDNILTAISVARECSLVNGESHIFVPRIVQGDSYEPNSTIEWESVDNPNFKLDAVTLTPIHDHTLTPEESKSLENYSLAIPGDVFRWIIDFAPQTTIHSMLILGQIFARMSPDEKHELVERLQEIEYCVGFCGDGANDCGALKAADVGISLSEAEASVAAPFTSRVFDTSCVPQIIREGRASLVTSFSCFKYMSLYSAIQFTTVSILYKSGSNLGDFQFLYIDLFLILPIAVFMSRSPPHPFLSLKRPTARLVSRKVLTPLLGQITLAFLAQLSIYKLVQNQPWYVPPTVDVDKSNIRNSANSTLFWTSCWQYIATGVILNGGRPYRRSAVHNYLFIATIFLTSLATAYLMTPGLPLWLFRLMDLTNMPNAWRVRIALWGGGYALVAWGAEKWVFEGVGRAVVAVKRVLGGGEKKRREWKRIMDGLRGGVV